MLRPTKDPCVPAYAASLRDLWLEAVFCGQSANASAVTKASGMSFRPFLGDSGLSEDGDTAASGSESEPPAFKDRETNDAAYWLHSQNGLNSCKNMSIKYSRATKKR